MGTKTVNRKNLLFRFGRHIKIREEALGFVGILNTIKLKSEIEAFEMGIVIINSNR